MSTFSKVAMGLLLALPLGAYIAGTLVASQAEVAPERPPVVVEGDPSDLVSATSAPTSSHSPGAGSKTPPAPEPVDGRDRNREDQPEVRVIRPTPHDLDSDREYERDDLDHTGDQTGDQTEDQTDSGAEDQSDDAEDEGTAPDDGEWPGDADHEDTEESHDVGDDD